MLHVFLSRSFAVLQTAGCMVMVLKRASFVYQMFQLTHLCLNALSQSRSLLINIVVDDMSVTWLAVDHVSTRRYFNWLVSDWCLVHTLSHQSQVL